MFAQWFRHPHVSRLRSRFAARRPRHPLARIALGLIGLSLLLVLVVVGVFVGMAMLLGAAVWRALKSDGKPQAAGRVIEGEFRHARDQALPQPR